MTVLRHQLLGIDGKPVAGHTASVMAYNPEQQSKPGYRRVKVVHAVSDDDGFLEWTLPRPKSGVTDPVYVVSGIETQRVLVTVPTSVSTATVGETRTGTLPLLPGVENGTDLVTEAELAKRLAGLTPSFPARLSEAALKAVYAAARDALPAASTAAEVTNDPNSAPPIFMDRDGALLRSGVNNWLERSDDGGVTWDALVQLPRFITGIRQLDNGELALGTGDNYPTNTIKSALYVTSGYSGGGAVTTTKVIEATDYQQSTALTWGFGGAGDVYVVAEYDSKAPGSRSASQKVWLTEDSFATAPTVIYDHGNGSTSSRHVHGAVYDPHRDAIIVTLGDYTGSATGAREIRVSWDRGDTWQTVTAEHQPTVVHVFPECWVFGTDNAPNGVLRIDRPSPTNLRIDVAYKVSNYVNPVTNQPAISHVAEAPFQASAPGAPLLLPFSVSVAGEHGLVLATTDGYAFEEVWRSPTTYDTAGYGPRRAIGPTADGRVLISGQSGATFWHAEAPAPVTGLTTAVARVARSLARAIPRRAYLAVANQSSPSFQTVTGTGGGGTSSELLLSLGAPTFADDIGDLFTVSPDGLGIIVNRDALVRIEIDSAMGQQFQSPRVALAINGSQRVDTPGRTISRTMWVRAGQRISGFGMHSGSTSPAVNGTSYGLVVDAWETY